MSQQPEWVLSTMRRSLVGATPEALERVKGLSRAQLASTLEDLRIAPDEVAEIAAHWDVFRFQEDWVDLLGSLLVTIESQRGDVDAPVAIWPDLDEAGPSGRLLYFYLFALGVKGLRTQLHRDGCPESVVEQTLSALVRHAAIHRRKWGTTGIDAGWWMMLILRGEMVQVASLQFHRVHLGVGTLSPSPWYSDDEMAALGPGFLRGDESLGVHIPERTDLSPSALDATFAEARLVLASLWPSPSRRLATCQSWMLDDQLREFLAPASNIIGFQDRFTLLPVWAEDDADTLEFVFRRPGVARTSLARETTLQRAILDVLDRGGHWRARTGWLDFDGA